MKKYLAALTTTALISIAPYALASSVDLTVTGTITPAACTPSFSNGGMVDLGKIAAKDLNQTSYTTLEKTPMSLSVACDAPALFAVHAVDNRPGTSFNNQGFGMGLTDANEKIGAFTPKIGVVEADGIQARAIDSQDNGSTWAYNTWIFPDRLTSVAEAGGAVTPKETQNLVINFDLWAWIARADGLTLTNEVSIDGSATFEMKYL
ncbi:TPA: DUF1120 domain-containing protein [Pseudomonas putida]|nr:DUF1120 domain-containing protein [Pseudomonas putida]